MFCKNCGQPMNNNQAVCLRCGVNAGGGTNFCANCGAQVAPGAVICTNCGVAVNPQAAQTIANGNNLNGQDKLTMALICFFLGGLGIHNFMMGESKKGIFKIVMLFCFGISGILALIDFIKILTDSYVWNPEKLV